MGKRTCPPSPVVKVSHWSPHRAVYQHGFHMYQDHHTYTVRPRFPLPVPEEQACYPKWHQTPTENVMFSNHNTHEYHQNNRFASRSDHTAPTFDDFLPPRSKVRIRKREVLLDISNLEHRPLKDVIHKNKRRDKRGNKINNDSNSPSCTVEEFLPPLSNKEKSHRVVKFRNEVSVVKIQSHRDYSQSDKRQLWTPSREIYKNARRNAYEYRADGRNWRYAAEEEDMWFDPNRGELIHPVHFARRSAPVVVQPAVQQRC